MRALDAASLGGSRPRGAATGAESESLERGTWRLCHGPVVCDCGGRLGTRSGSRKERVASLSWRRGEGEGWGRTVARVAGPVDRRRKGKQHRQTPLTSAARRLPLCVFFRAAGSPSRAAQGAPLQARGPQSSRMRWRRRPEDDDAHQERWPDGVRNGPTDQVSNRHNGARTEKIERIHVCSYSDHMAHSSTSAASFLVFLAPCLSQVLFLCVLGQ